MQNATKDGKSRDSDCCIVVSQKSCRDLQVVQGCPMVVEAHELAPKRVCLQPSFTVP